jgi:hypothetical protein
MERILLGDELMFKWMSAARGILLYKDTVGGIRPIGIREVWTRLAAGCLARKLAPRFQEVLGAQQFGAPGIPGGTEAVIHITRALFLANPEGGILKTDMANAFGTISRSAILDQLNIHIPELVPYFSLMYLSASKVTFDNGVQLDCSSGVTQGDPLASPLFELGVNPAFQAARSAMKAVGANSETANLLALADDGTLIGTMAQLRVGYNSLGAALADRGLKLVASKCALLVHQSHTDAGQALSTELGIRQVQGCIELLGSAIGESLEGAPDHEWHYFRDRVAWLMSDFLTPMTKLPKKPHSEKHPLLQTLYLVLKLCVVPRMTHLLRTIPPRATLPECKRLDAAVVQAIAEVFDIDKKAPGTNWDLTQKLIHMPESMGGIGIPSAEFTCHAAYIGSIALIADSLAQEVPSINSAAVHVEAQVSVPHQGLIAFKEAGRHVTSVIKVMAPEDLDFQKFVEGTKQERSGVQAAISSACNNERLRLLKAGLDPAWGTMFNAVEAHFAGAHLSVLPSIEMFRMSDETFKACMRFRLLTSQQFLPPSGPSSGGAGGSDLSGHDPPLDGSFPCPFCSARNGVAPRVDALGHHVFKCDSTNSFRIAKHNFIRDVLGRILRETWNDVRIEPTVAPDHYEIREGARQQSVKGDIGLFMAGSHLESTVDISIAGINMKGHTTAAPAGHAARAREASKVKHYTTNTTMPENKVIAFVLETLGAWGEQAVDLIKGRAIAATDSGTMEDPAYPQILRRYVQRIAFALQKGNGSALVAYDRRLRHRVPGGTGTAALTEVMGSPSTATA